MDLERPRQRERTICGGIVQRAMNARPSAKTQVESRWVEGRMWLSEWRRRRQRKAVTREFERYLSPAVADKLVSRPELLRLSGPERAHVGYVLAQVRDDVLDDIPAHFRKAMDATLGEHGLIDPSPPLLWVVFGLPAPWSSSADRRTELAARLIADLGTDVKVVTGAADALYGNFGNKYRFTYSVAIEGFGTVLAALARTDYGHAMEI